MNRAPVKQQLGLQVNFQNGFELAKAQGLLKLEETEEG